MCIANKATGGPELLHQLAHALRKRAINAFMLYVEYAPNEYDSPVHDNYKLYDIPYTFELIDDDKNILILPEVSLGYINNYSSIKKVVWWLSVDYSLYQFELIERLKATGRVRYKLLIKLIKNLRKIPVFKKLYDKDRDRAIKEWFKKTNNNQSIYHLGQSYYAMNFLNSNKVQRYAYLSDYLRVDYLENSKHINQNLKQDIVAYNPKKGFKFTKKIIDNAREQIKFVPIENMTYDEVTKLLSIAKVYIDFGEHPGKDRIPREAAIMKCCVITGLKGSASFENDINIPIKYKFFDKEESIPHIISTIKTIFDNYENVLKEYQGYREKIFNEPKSFEASIDSIFLTQ